MPNDHMLELVEEIVIWVGVESLQNSGGGGARGCAFQHEGRIPPSGLAFAPMVVKVIEGRLLENTPQFALPVELVEQGSRIQQEQLLDAD
jgi:hypothetical protein